MSEDLIPDDMTELYDAEVPRIDLVGKGANGMPLLIAKAAEDAPRPGLFDPSYVRELIAKSEKPGAAGTTPQEVVTMSGSPAAMAEVMRQMHGAPVRKAEPQDSLSHRDYVVLAKAVLAGCEYLFDGYVAPIEQAVVVGAEHQNVLKRVCATMFPSHDVADVVRSLVPATDRTTVEKAGTNRTAECSRGAVGLDVPLAGHGGTLPDVLAGQAAVLQAEAHALRGKVGELLLASRAGGSDSREAWASRIPLLKGKLAGVTAELGLGEHPSLGPVDFPTALEALLSISHRTIIKAEASTASMNDRDDKDFAYVESGGTKDETGKTVPRSLRHYPIYDEAHARNALGRAGAQLKDGDADAKRIARAALPKIRAAAKKFGIDVAKAAPDLPAIIKDLGMDMDDLDALEDLETSAGMPVEAEPDSLDTGVVLAAPDCEMPGDPNEPGSAAWEAIDAATARKWTTIAARLRSALRFLADREQIEGAYADGEDFYAACDLMDAADAVDYAISVLAPFAIDEQAEADEACMAMVGKAMAGIRTADLETLETLGAVRKAGRALSAANESALRNAISALQTILASLPKAPDAPAAAEGAAMQKEQPMTETDTALTERHNLGTDKQPPAAEAPAVVPGPGAVAKAEATAAAEAAEPAVSVEKTAAPLQSGTYTTGTTGTASTVQVQLTGAQVMSEADLSALAAKTAGQIAKTAADAPAPVAKAGKPPQVAIYDAHGNLVGTVDPAEITMLAPAKAPEAADGDGMPEAEAHAEPEPAAEPAAPAAPPTDLTPAPAAEAGTPADAVPDGVAKNAAPAEPAAGETQTLSENDYVLKSSIAELIKAALETNSATQEQALAKQAQEIAQLAEVKKALEGRNAELEERIEKNARAFEERLTALENAPAVMAIASNGALPPPHLLRGQNHGAGASGAGVDQPTAALLKTQFRNADDAIEQKRTAEAMTVLALEKFQAMQQDARRR